MYNFAKLSQTSQIFVGTLKASTETNVAVAKAIAAFLPLPTFVVDNPAAQYKDTCSLTAANLVSDISEVTVINYREVLERTRELWLARYYTLNPLEHNYAKDGDPMACFLGINHVLSTEVCKVVWDGGTELITKINGFAQIIRELSTITRSEDSPTENHAMLAPRIK